MWGLVPIYLMRMRETSSFQITLTSYSENNNCWHLECSHSVPDTVLSDLYVVTYLMLTPSMGDSALIVSTSPRRRKIQYFV